MGTGWRHLALAGGLRLAALGLMGVVGAAALGGGADALTAVRAKADGKPRPGQLSSAQNLVASRAAALARAAARASTLGAALSGLRAQSEALAERYDHAVSLEQQAAAAYQVAQARLAVARSSERRAAAQLAELAAAEYEAYGGPSMAAIVFAGITDPRGYLGALGLQQAMNDQRADLLAAMRADVPLAGLRRGDLVFYAFNIADPATIHHVGIYLGHGLMVDAPYTGSFVRIDSIYAFPGLIGATRPAA
jgi:cell wall-associated NlpC family hydrolase